MYIGIDTDSLIKHNLTPNQLIVGRLIANRKFITLAELIDSNAITTAGFKKAVDSLVSKKLFTNESTQGDYDLNLINPLPSFLDIVAKKDKFEELLAVYPSTVIRPDGSNDYLKVDLVKSKKEYEKHVKMDLALHNHILKCLKYELNVREREGNMKYMKRLINWITSEEWRSYEERMTEEPLSTTAKEDNLGYGNKLE